MLPLKQNRKNRSKTLNKTPGKIDKDNSLEIQS